MNLKEDEIQIIKQLLKGYVLPITVHNEGIIDKLIKSSFLLNEKRVKLIKKYSIELEDVFYAKLDTRFELEKVLLENKDD